MIRISFLALAACLVSVLFAASPAQAKGTSLIVPINRSEMLVTSKEMAEVIVSNPEIADVHVHGATRVSVIGKKLGTTNLRILDKDNNVVAAYDITVSYDLPAIRRSLHNFFPYEKIGVDLVNTNVALTGNVSNAAIADRAVQVVNQFVEAGSDTKPSILNLLQVTSGQQVMLRVRVGEIQRDAIKNLGLALEAVKANGEALFSFATLRNIDASEIFGTAGASVTSGNDSIAGVLDALERNGMFKVLAEPNLIALSGEQAEFLAGGEFPVPQDVTENNDGNTQIGVEFKPFGVAVQFVPYVLSDSRIRISVQPEVSELTEVGALQLASGVSIPAVSTRRAKTTVELAPGESFMIAGLVKDEMRSTINQLPGLGEIPVLSALFRSTQFQRNETELVIAVTPYLVDPLKSSDVRLPTDDFRPASVMESVFYGAMGSISHGERRISQTPALEGPIGFMVD